MRVLQRLLHKHALSLTAEKHPKTGELAWVVRSTRAGEDFYCAFVTEDEWHSHDFINCCVMPAITALERIRVEEISAT
jgi:hypothetical protein